MAPERMESKNSFKIYSFKLLLFKFALEVNAHRKIPLTNCDWLQTISWCHLVNLLAWFNSTAPQLLFGWEHKEGTRNLRWKIWPKHVLHNLNILLLKNRKYKETPNKRSDSAQNSGLVQNNLQGKKVLFISFLKNKIKWKIPHDKLYHKCQLIRLSKIPRIICLPISKPISKIGKKKSAAWLA